MITNPELTQTVINKLVNCPECIASIRDTKCYDYKAITPLGLIYEARFGAFIRVKYGIITLNSIDWPKVAQAMESQL
jgi:hypothetical protein